MATTACSSRGRVALPAGEESAPGKGSASHHEDHVSTDVAWAFGQFADMTGDTGFAREHAWPVLQGVADWIASRVTRTRRGSEIRRSMGIAERERAADNQAFTNMGAVMVLRQAVRVGAARVRRWIPDGQRSPTGW